MTQDHYGMTLDNSALLLDDLRMTLGLFLDDFWMTLGGFKNDLRMTLVMTLLMTST